MKDRPLLKVGIGLVALAMFGVTACQQSPFVKMAGGSETGSERPSSVSPVATSAPRSSAPTTAALPPATSPDRGMDTPGANQLVMTLPDQQAGPAVPTETAVPITTQLAAESTATPTTRSEPTRVATTAVVRSSPSSTPTVAVAPAPTTQSAAQPTDQQNYQLCGQTDQTIGQAIGQFIAGRNFSAQLVSRSNGCASLTIKILPGRTSSASGSHQSTHLSVTANARNIDVDIVSENGVTRASVVSKS